MRDDIGPDDDSISDFTTGEMQPREGADDKMHEIIFDAKFHGAQFPEDLADRERIEELHAAANANMRCYENPQENPDIIVNSTASAIKVQKQPHWQYAEKNSNKQRKSDKYNVYEYFEPRLDTLATVPNCQERADLKYVTSDTVLSVRARSQYPSPSPPRPNWGVKNGLKKLETKFGEIDM